MAQTTAIAWTDHTFNPWWGCQKVSPGCQHCYAEPLSVRRGRPCFGPRAIRQTMSMAHWKQPQVWNARAVATDTRRKVFCGSMCDWCEDRPEIVSERRRLWDVIRATPALDWQLLTKRPDRIRACLPDDWDAYTSGYPNVWLGVSIENNDYVNRADILRAIPAVVRFVSYEPALGPLDRLELNGLDWLIYGGESGPNYRNHDIQWARDIRARCEAADVAFFYKQSPAPRTEMGTTLDGKVVRNYPSPRATAMDPNRIRRDGWNTWLWEGTSAEGESWITTPHTGVHGVRLTILPDGRIRAWVCNAIDGTIPYNLPTKYDSPTAALNAADALNAPRPNDGPGRISDAPFRLRSD